MDKKYIVMVGTAGAGAALETFGLKPDAVKARFPRFFVKNAECLRDELKKLSEGFVDALPADFRVNLSGKSILSALWELGEVTGSGFEVIFDDIPLDQFTIEITELFGLNPYEESAGEGCLLVLSEPEKALSACKEAGVRAAVIGSLNETKARTAVTAEGVRYLNK